MSKAKTLREDASKGEGEAAWPGLVVVEEKPHPSAAASRHELLRKQHSCPLPLSPSPAACTRLSQVVTQVVKAKLAVGHVRHVSVVRRAPLLLVQTLQARSSKQGRQLHEGCLAMLCGPCMPALCAPAAENTPQPHDSLRSMLLSSPAPCSSFMARTQLQPHLAASRSLAHACSPALV